MNKSSITVLIPTKNRRDFLERALSSVFIQTVKAEEIVVINDGSTDGTKEFLDSLILDHPTLKVIHRNVSGGVNTARNQGMKESSSEWIAWLDDDDEFFPEAIHVMKSKIGAIPDNFNVLFFNSLIDTGKEKFVGGFQFKQGEKYHDWLYEELMVKKGLKGDCKPLFRKTLFDFGAYKFPESVNGFESYTLYLMGRDNKGIRMFPEVLTYIHLERSFEHLSYTAPAKNPYPLLRLHINQLFQHYNFYLFNPKVLLRKIIEMMKLGMRVLVCIFYTSKSY